jgi:hypothetical protein
VLQAKAASIQIEFVRKAAPKASNFLAEQKRLAACMAGAIKIRGAGLRDMQALYREMQKVQAAEAESLRQTLEDLRLRAKTEAAVNARAKADAAAAAEAKRQAAAERDAARKDRLAAELEREQAEAALKAAKEVEAAAAAADDLRKQQQVSAKCAWGQF